MPVPFHWSVCVLVFVISIIWTIIAKFHALTRDRSDIIGVHIGRVAWFEAGDGFLDVYNF
jgi:hypothetical protein